MHFTIKNAKTAETCGFACGKREENEKVKTSFTIKIYVKYEEIKSIIIKKVLS
jgi:hypothetical protein